MKKSRRMICWILCFNWLFYIGCVPSASYQAADEKFKAEKYEEAVPLYKKAIAEKPDNIQAKNGLAQTYLKLGKYELAKKEASESLAIKPGQSDAILHLGTAYIGLKNYKMAEETWKKYKDNNQPKITEEVNRMMTLLRYEVAKISAKQTLADSVAIPIVPNTVAVCDFKDVTPDKSMTAIQKALTVSLIEALSKFDGLKVIDRVQTLALKEAILAENPHISGPKMAALLKKGLGAESIIMGTLAKGSIVADSFFVGKVDGISKIVIPEADLFKLPGKITKEFCKPYGKKFNKKCPTYQPTTTSNDEFKARGKTTSALDRGQWSEARKFSSKSGRKHRRIPMSITNLSMMLPIIAILLVSRILIAIPVVEGAGCFDPDTLVLMADGSSKRIIDIKVGDMVMAYDEKKQKKVAAEVLATKNGIGDHHYVINDEIRVTPPHPFYTADNRWVKIADLKAGQDVRISSSFSKIKTLKKFDNGFKIYNISVKDHHNFYVSGKGKEFFLVQQGN